MEDYSKDLTKKPFLKRFWWLGMLAGIILLSVTGVFVWLNKESLSIGINGGPFENNAKGLAIQPILGEKKTIAIVEKTGGTVALDGEKAKFNLSFPDKSVYDKQDVKVQEINSISGMGAGAELLAGVAATPNGTTLFQPAELTFNISVGDKKMAGFAYDENGANFHLVPLFIKNGKPTIYLTHFSGYGIINVGDGSYTPPMPQGTNEQAAYLIGKIVAEARARQKTGDETSFTDDEKNRIYNLLNVWYKLKIKPDLEKSVGNDDLIEPAFNNFNTWRAGVMLVGLTDRFEQEIEASENTAALAVKNAYEKASKKCTENKDVTQIAKMTKWAAFAQYWGLDGRSKLDTKDLIEKTKKCAIFELRINSTIRFPKAEITTSASGTVQIGMDSNYNLVGHGEVGQTSWTQKGFACSYVGGAPPKFPVDVVSTRLTTVSKEQKINIILQFDEPDNDLHCVSTVVDNFTSDDADTNWLGDYFVINYDEIYIPDGKFAISDWQIVNSGGVYAKKSVSRDKTISMAPFSYVLNENTTYELIHKPQ